MVFWQYFTTVKQFPFINDQTDIFLKLNNVSIKITIHHLGLLESLFDAKLLFL